MEVVEKIFADLESNNLALVEESKKKIAENFSSSKESWMVNGMMEYFSQTNSRRIVDILVKVQPPHDKYILDRLVDWIHGHHKIQAITLFSLIVKKHPSWIHKVASHPLLKEMLKLLKTEPNIVESLSALFCMIILLPIIPTSIPQYLQDLFDIFLYLATWNCMNQPRLTEDQLIHLQIGLSVFFQRLYGMYPCNFIAFLRDYVLKDHKIVFNHTIRPLLETVKLHPLLLISNQESEKNNIRWREMEPHDVVVECSKFSLDYFGRVPYHHQQQLDHQQLDHQQQHQPYQQQQQHSHYHNNHYSQNNFNNHQNHHHHHHHHHNHSALYTPEGNNSISGGLGSGTSSSRQDMLMRRTNTNTPVSEQLQHSMIRQTAFSVGTSSLSSSGQVTAPLAVATPTGSDLISPFYSSFNEQPKKEPQRFESLWSPLGLLATPPPTIVSLVPVTPSLSSQQLCASGASPPEAAVEATPETTPMKDSIDTVRSFPVNSSAARAIWKTSTGTTTSAAASIPLTVGPSSSSSSAAAAGSAGIYPPTSPLKKEPPLNYRFGGGGGSGITTAIAGEHILSPQLQSSQFSSPKIRSFLIERHQYQQQMQIEEERLIEHAVIASLSSPSPSQSPSSSSPHQQQGSSSQIQQLPRGSSSNSSSSSNADLKLIKLASNNSSKEDQEVREINSLIRQKSIDLVEPLDSIGLDISSTTTTMTGGTTTPSTGGTSIESNRPGTDIPQKNIQRSIQEYSRGFQQWQIQNKCSPDDHLSNYSKSCPTKSSILMRNRPNLSADNENDERFIGIIGFGEDDSDDNGVGVSGGGGTNGNDDENDENPLKQPYHSKILRSKRNNFAKKKIIEKITIGTQTLEQVPQHSYDKIFLNLLSSTPAPQSAVTDDPAVIKTNNESGLPGPTTAVATSSSSSSSIPNIAIATTTNKSTPLSPNSLLDQYIETSIKRNNDNSGNNRNTGTGTSGNNATDTYQVELLNLQLQYERYRREVHAERNRRLLGKSRANAASEMENEKFRDQRKNLIAEVDDLTAQLIKSRQYCSRIDNEHAKQSNNFHKEIQQYRDENKQLQANVEALQRRLIDEKKSKQLITMDLEVAQSEVFHLSNELQQTQIQAEQGVQYKEELNRLQAEALMMGEIQMKCKEKLNELNSLKSRDIEAEIIYATYDEEVRDMRHTLDIKSAQLDGTRNRLIELEAKLANRDIMFTDQKRLLKNAKEEYEDKFKSVETKYEVQKSIILRLEEEILELHKKCQSAVKMTTTTTTMTTTTTPSDASDRTDTVGSLDHTSSLSVSLASNEGISNSLRSVTEIRNLHPLVTAHYGGGGGGVGGGNSSSRSTTIMATGGGGSGIGASGGAVGLGIASSASSSSSSTSSVAAAAAATAGPSHLYQHKIRQPASDDIPMPPGSSNRHTQQTQQHQQQQQQQQQHQQKSQTIQNIFKK